MPSLALIIDEISEGLFKQRFEVGKTRISIKAGANNETSFLKLIKEITIEGTTEKICKEYIQQVDDLISKVTPDSDLDPEVKRRFVLCFSDTKFRMATSSKELLDWYDAWKSSIDGTFKAPSAF